MNHIDHTEPSTMNCRYCTRSLDNGDIFEVLKAMRDEYPQMVLAFQAAKEYGWTPKNRIRFTKEILIQPEQKAHYTICPFCSGIEPLNPFLPKVYHVQASQN
jgi:hypothetical protein